MEDKEEKVESTEIEVISSDEVEVWRPGKTPISFLKCGTCYLRKDCPYCDVNSKVCALQQLETIDMTTPAGIVEMIQTVLAAQAQRVLRFTKIEEAEGGFPDPAVTQELMAFVALVEKFKKIISDEDFLVIKAKGPAAKGFMNRLFKDLDEE